MDVGGSIEFGLDFAEEIRKAISLCDALIVLIGRHWLDVRDASGRRRLDDQLYGDRRDLGRCRERPLDQQQQRQEVQRY